MTVVLLFISAVYSLFLVGGGVNGRLLHVCPFGGGVSGNGGGVFADLSVFDCWTCISDNNCFIASISACSADTVCFVEVVVLSESVCPVA